MPGPSNPDAILDAISSLAMDIARQCPDCADHATKIAALAGEIRAASVDRGAVQDVLDSEMIDSGDLSDVHVRATTEAVVRAAEREG